MSGDGDSGDRWRGGWHGRGGGGPGWHDRRRRWARQEGPPPWWPEGESWPPSADRWPEMRRRFLLRVGLLAFFLFLLAVVLPIVAVWHILSAMGLGARAGIFVLGFIVFMLVVATWMGGNVRRFALPLGDLIEAAERLRSGDYRTRVAEARRGPRELRSLAHAFNEMATRLEADEAQRRTLLADVSHELRTPLAVLQGQLEAMVDGVHSPDEVHLGAALEETRVLGRLVEDLRTLALAEAGALALHREPTDLGVLAAEVVAAFETVASPAGVSVELTVGDGVPIVDVDPVRIRQVLTNLLANALRYAPAGSTVTLDIALIAARTVRVEVRDAGPGIPPELLPRIFERFAKSPESRGSGLGLAIARRLVEAHGGRIEASSPPGGGTVIRFELPVEA